MYTKSVNAKNINIIAYVQDEAAMFNIGTSAKGTFSLK